MNLDHHPTGCACAPCRGLTPDEAAAVAGGEQGPDAHDLELARLRAELAEAVEERRKATAALAQAAVNAQRDELVHCTRVILRAPIPPVTKAMIIGLFSEGRR